MLRTLTALLLALLILPAQLRGQDYYRAEVASLTDSTYWRDRLGVRLLAQGFFRNNEYATDLTDDYTLPGYRLRADLGYSPQSRLPVLLRLGLTNLYYWGAADYPAGIAYQDLPYWHSAGERYTKFRLLPFFQATILPTPGLTLTLGNLEGGIKHGLIAPLYNPELNLTADEEHGFQLRYADARTFVDSWIDWQSFLFKGEHHQEAFAFGLHARTALLLRPQARLDVAFQALAHHRGGTMNQRADTVHTWINAALGVSYTQQFALGTHPLRWRSSVYALGYSQRGEHFPLSHGTGFFLESDLEWRRWQLRLALWGGTDYIAPLGEPFTQSLGREKTPPVVRVYSHRPRYLSLQGRYRIVEGERYSFGASAGIWWHQHSPQAASTFMEVYLSVSPYFRLLGR